MNTGGINEIPSCRGGLENLDEEHSYWIDEIEGEVPIDLEGTFFRNGPGRIKKTKEPLPIYCIFYCFVV